MRKLNYAQICQLYSECHGPPGADGTHDMRWAKQMEQKLGPDNGKGFIIRGRESHISGLYLMKDCASWCGSPHNARLFTWGETAVRITNNPKLEAIRVEQDDEVRDSKGWLICIWRGKDKDG